MDDGEEVTVWADASILALGVVCEKGGLPIEDMSWLRKKNDVMHINVAELEAVAKAINIAVKWGGKHIKIKSDSATVVGWVKVMLSQEQRVKTTGAAELLVKRRLAMMRQLIDELQLTVSIELVPTEKNKADGLTRVPKKWLDWVKREERTGGTPGRVGNVNDGMRDSKAAEIKRVHELCHFGVERTKFLVDKSGNVDATLEEVKRVVGDCVECGTIDPAPTQGEGGVCQWPRTGGVYRGM